MTLTAREIESVWQICLSLIYLGKVDCLNARAGIEIARGGVVVTSEATGVIPATRAVAKSEK